MKNVFLALSGIVLSACFFSCQKTDVSDLNALQMDIESKKVNDKKNLYVGQEYQGGIIFYLDETGQHGLIVGKEDLGPAPWGCDGLSIPEAQGSNVGDGQNNTNAILNACTEPGIAARICDNYVVREKGENGKKYDDWFLPSSGELWMIAQRLKEASTLGCNKFYVSSTEATGMWKGELINPQFRIWIMHNMCYYPGDLYSGVILYPVYGKVENNMGIRPVRDF